MPQPKSAPRPVVPARKPIPAECAVVQQKAVNNSSKVRMATSLSFLVRADACSADQLYPLVDILTEERLGLRGRNAHWPRAALLQHGDGLRHCGRALEFCTQAGEHRRRRSGAHEVSDPGFHLE